MLVAFFILSTVLAVLVLTAIRPPLTHRPPAVRPPWFPVMLVTELAPIMLAVVVATAGIGVLADAREETLGRLGLLFLALSALGLVVIIVVSLRTKRTLQGLPASADIQPVDPVTVLWANPYRLPSQVEVDEAIVYDDGLLLDLYGRAGSVRPDRPVMIQVHGGSWSGGTRDQQARPFIHGLAERDWAVASIDYPLVPGATFPDNLVAVHQAVAWVRRNADRHRFDASRIFLTGGSSGAHLASLAALTDGETDLGSSRNGQAPIAGAVTFYGVYDLLNRRGIRDNWPIVSRGLLKADPTERPELFKAASPIDRVHESAPPFVIVHGKNDSLVPYAESVYFAESLEAVSKQPVDLILLPGASHAFDAIPSIRTQQVVNHLAAVLDTMTTVGE